MGPPPAGVFHAVTQRKMGSAWVSERLWSRAAPAAETFPPPDPEMREKLLFYFRKQWWCGGAGAGNM